MWVVGEREGGFLSFTAKLCADKLTSSSDEGGDGGGGGKGLDVQHLLISVMKTLSHGPSTNMKSTSPQKCNHLLS